MDVQPQDQRIILGNDATFTVSVTGQNLVFQWQLSSDNGVTYSDISGATNASYTYNNGAMTDNGNLYRVLVSQTNGVCNTVTSNAALLWVLLDTDGDNIADEDDYDDDNDGIPDLDEQSCVGFSPGSLGVATIVQGGTGVNTIYTDYNGFWQSSSSAVNAVQPNTSHNLLAFENGGTVYTTGVINSNLIDSDSDGLYDQIDTNGDAIGDVSAVGLEWEAFRPSTVIQNKVGLESSNNDGNTSAGLGLTIINNPSTDPLNPLLTNGSKGLDLGTGIANVNDSWYYSISTMDLTAIGDGVPDILLTQVADVIPLVSHQVTFYDASGNPVGNSILVDTNNELGTTIGNQKVDIYYAGGNSWQTNIQKSIRMVSIELSEFGINASNYSSIVLMELKLNANADTAFIAYNKNSFGDFCEDLDTDLDGIPDRVDLDSDNDGIYDVVEAGHVHAHTNGVLTGTVGTDGIPDVVQSNPNNQTTNYTLRDSDADGISDFQEMDSDNDGCNDADEAYGLAGTDSDSNGMYGSGTPGIDGQGRVTAAAYPAPNDGDSNGTFDFREFTDTPTISSQPMNVTTCPGCSTSISVSTSNVNVFQWQLFNGSTWEDITDSGIYSGSTTNTLNIINATSSDNGNEYRVLVSNSAYTCITETSTTSTLTINVQTVITNRRITYRVRKN